MIVINEMLNQFAQLIEKEKTMPFSGPLKVGVDLGTANIVISVVDANNKPVAGAMFPSTVVKDGIVVDEPTAAAHVLSIKNGAVVDVGGGTTGISILKDGEVIFTADEPTGGTHMTLTIAGYYGISIIEAEEIKKDASKESDNFAIIKPVVQKMASIVKGFLEGFNVDAIYIVGGACCFSEFEEVFEKEVGIKTIKSNQSLLVTPLGIAFNCK